MLKKTLLFSMLIASIAHASSSKMIKEYLSDAIASRGAKLHTVKFYAKKPIIGTEAYLQPFTATIYSNGKKSEITDALVVNGDYIAENFYNMKQKKMAKDIFNNKPTASFYKKDNLIAGNIDAKNKTIVFSDPLCPICKEVMPKLIAKAKANPTNFAVFLYHFPISTIHPASETLINAINYAKTKGYDITSLVYSLDFPDVENKTSALAFLNNSLGKASISLRISEKDTKLIEVRKMYNSDLQFAKYLWVGSTPTAYTNNEIDYGAIKFLSL